MCLETGEVEVMELEGNSYSATFLRQRAQHRAPIFDQSRNLGLGAPGSHGQSVLEIKGRCRTALQAKADELIGSTQANPLHSAHIDFTVDSV